MNENNIGEWNAETIHYTASYAYEQKTANEGVEDFEELVDLHNKDYPFPELELDWQEEDDSLEIKFPKLAKRCDELFK